MCFLFLLFHYWQLCEVQTTSDENFQMHNQGMRHKAVSIPNTNKHSHSHRHTHTHIQSYTVCIDLWATSLFSPILCTSQGTFLYFSVPHKLDNIKPSIVLYCSLYPYKVIFVYPRTCTHESTNTKQKNLQQWNEHSDRSELHLHITGYGITLALKGDNILVFFMENKFDTISESSLSSKQWLPVFTKCDQLSN